MTMIWVGSGSGGLREPNQLQADRQAKAISRMTLNRYARAGYEARSLARSARGNYRRCL